MITDFKCNRVFLSAKMASLCPKTYIGLTTILDRHKIAWSLLDDTNDIWCRDFMPIQIVDNWFAGYTYYPDYLSDTEKHKKMITDGNRICRRLGYDVSPLIEDIIIDGGNVVKCEGKIIMTSKVFEENPQYTVSDLSKRIENTLGAELIVIPWDVHEYFGHSDGICRYIGDNSVLMTNYSQIDLEMANRIRKCLTPHFKEVYELKYQIIKPHKYSWAYINWLQTDKIIILPAFGIPEDIEAFEQIEEFIPSYKGNIEMINANDLIIHEGGLNCASWTVEVPFIHNILP